MKEWTLNEWAAEIHRNAVAHGWWEDDRGFAETAALITCEISEAVEEDRSGNPLIYIKQGKPEGVAVEVVDAVIRALDWLAFKGVDVEEVMAVKHNYNLGRPYKHGKRY